MTTESETTVGQPASQPAPLVLVTLAGGGWHRETCRILEQYPPGRFRFAYIYGHHGGNHSAARLEMPHPGPRYSVHYLGPTRKHASRWIANPARFVLSCFEAVWLVCRLRPNAVLAVGHPAAVPLFFAARLFGARTVFVESLTRAHALSVTGRVLYRLRLAQRMFVQWPALCRTYSRCVYAGSIL